MVRALSTHEITQPKETLVTVFKWYTAASKRQSLYHEVESLTHDIRTGGADIGKVVENINLSLRKIVDRYFIDTENEIDVTYRADGGKVYLRIDITITTTDNEKIRLSDEVDLSNKIIFENARIYELYYEGLKL